MKKGIADSPKTHPDIWSYLLTKSWIEFKRKIRKSTIPKELEPLAEEARKYKTFEEFKEKGVKFIQKWFEQTPDEIWQSYLRNPIIYKIFKAFSPPYGADTKELEKIEKPLKIFYSLATSKKLENNIKKSLLKGERIIWRTKYSF